MRFQIALSVGLLLSTAAPAMAEVTRQEVSEIIAAIPPRGGWSAIEISEYSPKSLNLIWHYDPRSIGVVENESESVATSIIKALVSRGHDPQRESISIHVNAMQDGLTTVTGKPAVRPFGDAYYNFAEDNIQWRPN
jgi:hypothetical protein